MIKLLKTKLLRSWIAVKIKIKYQYKVKSVFRLNLFLTKFDSEFHCFLGLLLLIYRRQKEILVCISLFTV